MDTPASVQKPLDPNCATGNCGNCVKGGIPMKREALSFFLIVFIILSTVLGVLYINAKRESRLVNRDHDDQTTKPALLQSASPSAYPLPVAATFSKMITLPKPTLAGKLSVEAAIATRRSIRAYTSDPVTLTALSQMLWSGQGQTDPSGKRAAPSSRESYPMTIYTVVQNVTGLEPGVYEYVPKTHSLGLIKTGDMNALLKTSSVEAGAVPAPVVFIVTASFGKYQEKTKSSNMLGTYLEAGHIGQNMYLQAQSLSMGMVVMAGFDTKKVTSTFGIDGNQTVEYVIPFGKPAPAPAPEK